MQAKYWKCLRGLTVQPASGALLPNTSVDLFSPPYGSTLSHVAVEAISNCVANNAMPSDDPQPLVSPRAGPSGLPHSLERSLRRNKLARAKGGKSSRRWHMLQTLHLAVVKSFLKKQRRQRRQEGSVEDKPLGNRR